MQSASQYERRSRMPRSKIPGAVPGAPAVEREREPRQSRNYRRLSATLQPVPLESVRRIIKLVRKQEMRGMSDPDLCAEVGAILADEWGRYVADYLESVADRLDVRLEGMEDASRDQLSGGLLKESCREEGGPSRRLLRGRAPLSLPELARPPRWDGEITRLIGAVRARTQGKRNAQLPYLLQPEVSAVVTAAVVDTLRPLADGMILVAGNLLGGGVSAA